MFDQQTERGDERPLGADSGQQSLAPHLIDTPASLQRPGGCGQRGLCPVVSLRLMPLGGSVNNVATGKINCRQAAGLRGSLWNQKERGVGKACDLWG